MKEDELGARIVEALDSSTEHLSYRVSQRLLAARQAAMGRAHTAVAIVGDSSVISRSGEPRPVAAFAALPRPQDPSHGWSSPSRPPSLLWRAAAVAVPVVLLLGGLVSVGYWDDQVKAEELAEVDTAVLTGDTPLDTLADRSFGVFVANSRQ